MADWWEKYKKDRNLGGNKKSSSKRTWLKKEVSVTDENRQTAKSSTWWEDYKKTRDLDSKVAANRQRAERSQRFASANRQLDENRSRDAAEDEIRELLRNPFSTDAEWQAGVLQRNAERYKRDLPLYQQALQNASTWGEYFSTHRQAGESQSAVKHQFERYQQAAQNAEQERNESNLVNRPAQWQAENLSPQEIEQRLAYYRSEAATPTVTDRDREEHAYLYPEAALKKVPHGVRFDERLLEGAGQDAIDALYRPILTEQEKAAVEEADQQIIKEKAERNYEQVQRLLAAQKGQTEATSRARGNELIEEIAQGGEAADRAKTGKAMFEQQQKKIDEESPTIIYGAHGNYSSAMAERTKRGYILGSDWDNVPDDRKQAVYALYTESPEKAIELAKFYIADAQQAKDEERQAWYAQSGWTAALGLASSAAAHLGSAVDPFGPVGQELTRYGDNALAGGSQWADAATGYQKIPEWVPVVGGKGAGDLYQTVGSVVQSAAVAAPAILAGRYDQAGAEVLSKLGLALMGSSAAASDYRESVAAGMDEDRAKLHALAAGVEEALFEEVSLDKLIKMDTSGGLKAALKNWLVQSGIEGSEELATSIANRFTDEMISGAGQSKVERRASELIANGMNSTEAHAQAESEWMTDTLYDGFSGFLSGGMMTGGNYALQGAANLTERAVNAAETRKAQKQAGAAVSRSEGSVEALQAYAKDKGIEIKTVETAEQNAGESAEQGSQDGSRQNSYSSRDYRSISETNSKVTQSIRNDLRGKTIQEQQTVRDSLVEKYGEGIAPVVNNAISLETASRVRQEYGDVDSIQAARNQAVSEIKDESLRRAVSDGYDSAAYSLAASQGGEGGMNTMSRYIQQRNNTGTGEMSMNATVTTQDGSTKTIAITGMSEDGKRVSLADGSEVAVKDLQADADTTSAIQQLADLDLGDDATKVLQAYQQSGISGTEGYRWLMDYATAYNQGRTRQISLEQAAQRSSLDERTVMDAYTLGQQAANRETLAGLEKLKNLPKRKGASGRAANIDTTEIKGKTMSKSELEQFEIANQYAQALGVDMTWFSSKEKDGKFIGKNGAYENGKIYMDIHAGRNFAADLTSGILATMGHELTHFQQQYAPEEYQAIKEFLFEQIVKSSPNGEARLERLIWEKQRRSGYTLSRKAAEDEVAADACQKMLRDSKAVHDFASQQPEAANGVVRWLDKWFKRVRSIFGRGGNYSEEAQIMDSLEQDVKAAFGELWDKALKQAVQVHDEVGNIEKATTEGESKAQNSDREDQSLRDRVSDLEERLEFAEINGLSQAEIRRLNNELIKARGQLDTYAANQRRQAKRTSFNEILRNLENYERVDLESLAEQISDSAWDDYDELSDEELIDALRETINERLEDFGPGEADNPKYGLYVKKPKTAGNISVVRYSDRDAEYLELAKDPEKNAARLQEMVDEAAKRAGFTSPMLFHGTNAFGFTSIKTSKDVHADGFSFWAANKESAAGTYTRYGKTREIESEIGYEETEEAIEERSADVDEAIDDFRYLIDRTFSEWFYGQQGNEEIRRGVDDSNPEQGYGDGVYDFLVDQVADAFNEYSDSLSETYEDFADFQERSKEWEKIEDAIVAIEGAYSALSEIQSEGLVGGIYELYANTDNMYVVDAKGAAWDALHPEGLPKIERGEYKNIPYKTRDVANWARDNGYDGVIFKNIKDNGAYGRTESFDVYAFFNPQAQVKSADPVTYDDDGNVIPLSERFNEANEDIRYSERDNAKPRSAQAQRDAGYKLSESKFYSLYSAHKLNMTGRGNVQEQIASIMADGFKGDGGFGNNVMPTNISYDVDENGKRIPRGLSAQKYAPKKGEYILLVPKEGVEVKGGRYNFTERVKPGYKPAFDYEIVQADYDGQPYYEMYERAYDKSQAGKANVTLDGAQFSMREPVEQTDRLIAWHNMNEDALRSALELGGLAMPSWAIKTADRAHTSYGSISVIAPRSLVDPKTNRSSMIFGGDAWTPVFPDVDYDISYDAVEKLHDEITGLIGQNVMRELGGASLDTENIARQLKNAGGKVSNYYKKNVALRYAYLKSIGENINVPRQEIRLDKSGQYDNKAVELFADRLTQGKRSLDYYRSMPSNEVMQQEDLKKAITDVMVARFGEEVRDVYAPDELSFRDIEAMLSAANLFYKNNTTIPSETDKYALAKEIDKVIDEEAYEKWIGEKLNKTIEKKGVRNEKDPFAPSGKRRSFDALHYAYNLANIVKAMKAQPKQGRTQFLSGPGSVKGAALKSYNTVEQVREDRGRLVNSAEEGQKAYDEYNRNLEDILDRMRKNGDRFDAADALIEVFQHAKTETGIYNYMQRELKDWYNISRELAHDAYELIGQINQLPMEYFEGKTYDAVPFDETAAVVVPDNIDPALKRQLNNAGARVVEYKAGDDSDRLAKVNSVEGAQFSERDYSTPSDEELLMNAKVEDAANVEQGRLLKDYQALGKRIATLEKQLAEAKRQTQLTNRALNTRGIGNVVKTVMKDYDITDARHNGTAKNATLALTEGYQKALDLLDKGASPAEVNDAVYNGAVKAAEIILEQGTYSQNLGGKWQTYSASRYLGENSQELIDSFVSEAYADFVSNRYREARPETAADRLVARTKKEAQERVDKYKGRSDALAEANRRLEEKKTQAETEAKEARKAAGELFLEIKDLRQELMDNKTMSEQERKAASKKLKSLNKSLEAKREEAASWQKRAKRNASLLKSALESKNRDISALNNRLSKEQAAALEKQKNLEAKLEKQIQRERDILAGKLRAPELVKLLKAEREKAEARVKEQKEQVFQNYKERKKATDLRGRIKNLSDEMKRRMTNPTDRAYVPASLYQSMTRLADVLDNVLSPNPGTKAEARYRAMMDAIRGMAREYEDVKNLDPVFASEYEQEISDAIGEIERILERKNASWIDNLTGDTQKSFAELNSDELQQLYDLMRQINYTITNATKIFGNSSYKSILDAQRAVAEQQNSMKSLNAVSRLERKKRLRLLNSLSVMRATEMMAGWDRSAALYQLMHGIEQGADDAWAWVMDYNKSLQDLKTGKNEKEYRQALTKQLDFGITDRDGLKVTMTKMQALQILMTAEREEHNDKLLHLQAGGAVIRNAIDLQNGKGAKARSQTISVTPELIQKINDSLTDWDRAYMKTVRDYFKREGKRTNEILYKLKHKVLKTEEFYVPYTVDRNYLEANLNEQQALNMWVKTPGSTNALKQKAKQPVIIDGMDTVMGQHVKEIGNYIGMAIPIRDFSKVYNGMIPTEGPNPLPVKETIERSFGKAGQHLLTQAVIDVQGGTARQNWESNIAQFLNKLQGAFVKSALLINPSVTIKQAASYIAAESVISHLALERGNHSVWARTDESKSFMPGGLIAQLFARPEGKTAQRIYNEIDQYTSLHYQRRQGMSMAEIAEQANRTGPIKRRINAIGASMEQSKLGHAVRRTGENLNPITWIQRMDVATTAALWVACKEQAKLDKLAVGSEEFWKRTTELYERCIRETQPMYDGLHRTANQKQAGGLMQYLFPFRTVPVQNHGQLAASYEAYKAARESKNEAKIKEAGKFFRKTVWAQTESAFVFSAMTFLAAILKRKTKKYRDEEGEFDAGSFTKGLLTDVGSTLISVLNPMYGSELFNLGSRAVDKFEGNSGYTYDAFSVGVVDMINDLASSGDRLLADAGKIVRGENVNAADFWNHAMNLLVKGGKLAGIPADTVKTYFEGTKGNIQDAIEGRIPALNDESWERDAATNARRYLKAYLDNDTKKASAVLAELRSNLSKNGKDEGKINEAIRKYVSAQAVEKVADGTWTEEEAEAYLLSTGAYDDRENPQKDAWNAIRKGVAKSTSTDEEYSWKQYDELAEAVANGEDVTGLLTEYRDHGYSDDQINAAIRSGIQEALTAGDLDGNEAADALIRYGVTYSKDGKTVAYDEQTAWKKVQEWTDKAEHTDEEGELEDGYKYSAYSDLFEAVDANQNAEGIIQTMVQNGGYDTDSLRGKIKEHLLERFIAGQITETALKNQLSRYCKIVNSEDANEVVANAKCKRDFGVYPDDLKEAFKDGDLSQNQAEKALQQYKGLSKADAQNRVQYWGYDGDLSENAWAKWAHELKSTGLSVDNWEKVYKVKSSAKGTDANGDGRADSGTVKAEVVSYIDSMNIPKSQKKAIYLAFGWAASTMPNWR